MNPALMMLKGLGIDIDPEEIMQSVQLMALHVAEMAASQKRTEAMIKALYEYNVNANDNQKENEHV
jgi:hypothetical protein